MTISFEIDAQELLNLRSIHGLLGKLHTQEHGSIIGFRVFDANAEAHALLAEAMLARLIELRAPPSAYKAPSPYQPPSARVGKIKIMEFTNDKGEVEFKVKQL